MYIFYWYMGIGIVLVFIARKIRNQIKKTKQITKDEGANEVLVKDWSKAMNTPLNWQELKDEYGTPHPAEQLFHPAQELVKVMEIIGRIIINIFFIAMWPIVLGIDITYIYKILKHKKGA